MFCPALWILSGSGPWKPCSRIPQCIAEPGFLKVQVVLVAGAVGLQPVSSMTGSGEDRS